MIFLRVLPKIFLWPHYSRVPGARGPGSLNRLNSRFLRHCIDESCTVEPVDPVGECHLFFDQHRMCGTLSRSLRNPAQFLDSFARRHSIQELPTQVPVLFEVAVQLYITNRNLVMFLLLSLQFKLLNPSMSCAVQNQIVLSRWIHVGLRFDFDSTAARRLIAVES